VLSLAFARPTAGRSVLSARSTAYLARWLAFDSIGGVAGGSPTRAVV
jgi:hypothetical protein